MVRSVWDHPEPRNFTQDYLKEQLTRLGIYNEVSDEEIETIANSILFTIVFSKDKLSLDDERSTVVANLTFGLFRNGDTRYEIEYPILKEEEEEEEEEEEQKGKKSKKNEKKKDKKQEEEEEVPLEDEDSIDRSLIDPSEATKDKNLDSDKNWLKENLKKIVNEKSGFFTKEQIAKIFSHFTESYFLNFDLFQFARQNKQLEEDVFIQVLVDQPFVPPPLHEAKFLGVIYTEEEKKQMEEEKRQKVLEQERQEKEAREREAEERRKFQEEWMGLDEDTIRMIKERVEKAKEEMLSRVDEKKAEYQEKLENRKGGKKKKK